MNREMIKQRLSEICKRVFVLHDLLVNIECIDLIEDLGMDSITFITLIVEIEDCYAIILPDDSILMENFRNANQIISMIEQCVREKGE